MEQDMRTVETLRRVNPETFAGGQFKEAWKPRIEMPDVAAQQSKDTKHLGEVRNKLASLMKSPQQGGHPEENSQVKNVWQRLTEKSWEENRAEIDDKLKDMPLGTRLAEYGARAVDNIDAWLDHFIDVLLAKYGFITEEELQNRDKYRKQMFQWSLVSRDMLRDLKNKPQK